MSAAIYRPAHSPVPAQMKAADWATVAEDVGAAANKLILLRTLYPGVDVFAMVAARPRTLLMSDAVLSENATQV